MVSGFHLPPTGFGPGSQPADDELGYMQMPSGMRTYAAHLPEIDDTDAAAPALALLERAAAACERAAATGEGESFQLADLPPDARALLTETLGQGEVSVRIQGVPAVAVQESVFAGVWRVMGAGVDRVEVGAVPARARIAFAPQRAALGLEAPKGLDVFNAPALLVELLDRSAAWRKGKDPHVVNLTLLPHTEGDLAWLDAALGEGAVTVLSRGYGNCRITATATANVWRVQYFNSMDTLILDTFEVTDMPEVVLAAPEDLADSAGRIRDVLEAIR
ncbi:hydrogenase expression/formation protein [Rhodovulum sulfidophilum]|uniref:Hydrogenase expression/formation protein n=1 Tax=Rhodovulum visakhapatnamense TaxID=364297 RepID=A0ABS1RBK0_9RHOB|nr:hydrogenase expression/formation protein [Rhodovulum visakhapatnamense]MBL3570361.1 hydrogenase expression/formation protein [Rhodovulum visakhapatnamense]MBL3576859.1 hydrogenase expression/formation protein [Rhodovulum visakhapatnamense]OLS43961.1 hydrogenase expression/formation protein [Rhodovulum sulfidophilum]